MRSSVLRQRLPLFALLVFVPGCFFKSSSTDVAPPGTTTQNPVPSGVALYKDVDRNGQVGAGDEIHMRFDRRLALNDATAGDLLLSVAGDSFGVSPEVQLDGSGYLLRTILGADASIKGRKAFDLFDLTAGASSAINVTSTDKIVDFETGGDSGPAPFPLDIVPGFVEGAQLTETSSQQTDQLILIDLDCDGVLDLVQTSRGTVTKAETPAASVPQGAGIQSALEVLKGSADGSFTIVSIIQFDGVPTALCAGDFDSDGRPDIALGRDQQDIVYRNTTETPGEITLSRASLLNRDQATRALIAVDTNQDGSVDLVAGDDDGVHVYLNLNGIGFDFAAPQINGVVHDLASGDLNGDGFPDVLIARDGADGVLLGSLTGLQPGTYSAAASMTSRVLLHDLDRDGDLDYIATKEGVDRVGLGEGNGLFFEQDLDSDARSTNAIALLDVDADGAVDMVRSLVDPNVDGDVLVIQLGRGNGEFDEAAQELPHSGASSFACGDIDLDGDVDFAANGTATRLWHGSLAGVWGAYEPVERTDVDLGLGAAEAITESDFTGDGISDLAIGGTEHVTLYVGQADGSYGEPLVLAMPATRTQDIAFADLDLDGDLDMLVASLGGPASLWLNEGSGEFANMSKLGLLPNATNVLAIAVGDLTGSGYPDIVLGRSRGHQDKLLINLGGNPGSAMLGDQGAGGQVGLGAWFGFVMATTSFSDEHTRDIAMGDVDCDGDLDLVFAHQNLFTDVVWLNSGVGFFQAVSQTLNTSYSRDLALADFDGDGMLDLAVGSFDSDQIWLGQGEGLFTLATVLDAADTQACDAADVNGDGQVDLLTAGAFGVQVRYGQLGGSFMQVPDLDFPDLQAQDIHLAELGRDGTLQIMIAAKLDFTAHRILASR